MKWLVLTYLGESGGTTRYGNIRYVFYSDTAAPYIRDILKTSRQGVTEILRALAKDPSISRLCSNQHIAKRFEDLLDLVEAGGS